VRLFGKQQRHAVRGGEGIDIEHVVPGRPFVREGVEHEAHQGIRLARQPQVQARAGRERLHEQQAGNPSCEAGVQRALRRGRGEGDADGGNRRIRLLPFRHQGCQGKRGVAAQHATPFARHIGDVARRGNALAQYGQLAVSSARRLQQALRFAASRRDEARKSFDQRRVHSSACRERNVFGKHNPKFACRSQG
jgi:hypothetical protein